MLNQDTFSEDERQEKTTRTFNEYDYDTSFQDKVIALAIRDSSFLNAIVTIINPEHFDDGLSQWVFNSCQEFYKRYKEAPGQDNLKTFILRETSLIKIGKQFLERYEEEAAARYFMPEIHGAAFVRAQVSDFAKRSAIYSAFNEGLAAFEKSDYGKIRDLMSAAVDVGTAQNENDFDEQPYTLKDPATLPLTPWVYGEKLIRGKATLLVAPGGVGKTFFTLTAALALTTGKKLSHDVVWDGPQRVRMWSLEEDRETLDRRIHAAAIHYHLFDDPSWVDRLFISTHADRTLCIARSDKDVGIELAKPVTDNLVESLIRQKIDVLIIDPFVSCHSVGENDNSAIDAVVKEWGRVAMAANCAVWLVHHTSKLRGEEANAESARGAKALVDGVRVGYALNTMSEKMAAEHGIDKPSSFIRCDNVKANYAPRNNDAEWYNIISVDLKNGDKPVGVMVPHTLEITPEVDGAAIDMEALWTEVAATGCDAHSYQTKEKWIGHAIAKRLNLNTETIIEKRRLMAVIESLVSAGTMGIEDKAKAGGKGKTYRACCRP